MRSMRRSQEKDYEKIAASIDSCRNQDQAETIEIISSETERLQKLQAKLSIYVRGWNEDELKIKFIE